MRRNEVNLYKYAANCLFELRCKLHGEFYTDEMDDKLHQLEQEFCKMAAGNPVLLKGI